MTAAARRRTARVLCLVAAGWIWPWACARVAFREAMEDVERRYVLLWDEFENGSNFAARDAARSLKGAFLSPAIAVESPHARDPDFQRFLADIVAALDGVEKEAERFTAEGAARQRSELAARCDACHDRFRTPDD